MNISVSSYKKIATLMIILFALINASGETNSPTTPQAPNIHVVFDLGGVLLTTSTSKILNILGKWKLLLYTLKTGKNPKKIKQKIYKILNTMQPTGNELDARDPFGDLLPGIMCDWQTGHKTGLEIINMINPIISNTRASSIEKSMLKKLIILMFEPEKLATTIKIIQDGIACVRACKDRGYIVHILSNWDATSFDLIYNTYPELFRLFEQKNIFISGQRHMMKPDHACFNAIKATDPDAIYIMVDDQPENIKAARQCGFYGILCVAGKNPIYQQTNYDDIYARIKNIAARSTNKFVPTAA